jgi:YegS/Rv2252/BmrU family lipid kinase
MTVPPINSANRAAFRFNQVALLLNTQSGRRESQKLVPLFAQAFRSRRITPEVFETSSARDLESQVNRAISEGTRLLFAAGGDGTLQGLVNAAFGFDVVLGVIPAGGGNDFAKALGLPSDPLAALAAALSGEPLSVDLARVHTADGQERLYLGGGGIGLDAESAKYANTCYRNWFGRSRYIVSMLRAFVTHRSNRVRVSFDNNKKSSWRNSILACVLNTPTFGAGIQLAPKARINDGLLDFAFLEELRFGRLLRILPRLAIRGTLELPQLHTMQIRKVRLETEVPAFFQGDGEILGPTPVDIEVVPNAVQFLAPKCTSI